MTGKTELMYPREALVGRNIRLTRRVPFWEDNRFDDTILERSGPIAEGDQSTHCGAKSSLGCTYISLLTR